MTAKQRYGFLPAPPSRSPTLQRGTMASMVAPSEEEADGKRSRRR
jgi:hypothetical protein